MVDITQIRGVYPSLVTELERESKTWSRSLKKCRKWIKSELRYLMYLEKNVSLWCENLINDVASGRESERKTWNDLRLCVDFSASKVDLLVTQFINRTVYQFDYINNWTVNRVLGWSVWLGRYFFWYNQLFIDTFSGTLFYLNSVGIEVSTDLNLSHFLINEHRFRHSSSFFPTHELLANEAFTIPKFGGDFVGSLWKWRKLSMFEFQYFSFYFGFSTILVFCSIIVRDFNQTTIEILKFKYLL